MRLSPHFTLAELTTTSQPHNNTPNPEQVRALGELARRVLEPWRAVIGPIRITSGFRSEAVNAAVGGSRTSGHKRATAADCKPLRVSQDEAWNALLVLIADGLPVRQAILYPGAQIHVEHGTDISSGGRLLVKSHHTGKLIPWRAPQPGSRR